MKVFNAIIVASLVVLAIIMIRHIYSEKLRIYRGVGVINDANEQPIAAGVISNSIIPDPRAGAYFDGVEMKSCELCPNATICPHCPNFMQTSGIEKMSAERNKEMGMFNAEGEVYTNDVISDFERANVLISEQNQAVVNDQLAAESAVYRGANYLTMGPVKVDDFFPNQCGEETGRALGAKCGPPMSCIYEQKERNLAADTEINRLLYGDIMGLDYLAPAVINEPTDISIVGEPYYRITPNGYEYKFE